MGRGGKKGGRLPRTPESLVEEEIGGCETEAVLETVAEEVEGGGDGGGIVHDAKRIDGGVECVPEETPAYLLGETGAEEKDVVGMADASERDGNGNGGAKLHKTITGKKVPAKRKRQGRQR